MTINISMPERHRDLKPRITVIGVGGAGGNAVNNMIRSNLSGVEFMVANTDAQSLELSQAQRRIQLGLSLTHGLGAGSRPDVGRAAAEEALDEIMEQLTGSHMVFITAGMGGGTGTGAAPVIARAAREHGILTVGVVTKPFHFEGTHRMRTAETGIDDLSKFVDTLIIIPNQNLFRVANERTTFAQAFQLADDVLYSGVRGVTDLMVMPGLINLDFADIRTVMSEMGKAMMGTGEATGEKRAIDAAEAAISNPLLDDMSMKGARGILINITGGLDMTLFEVDEAANRIRDEVDPDANIIFGATFDESLEGVMRVSVVATGIDAAHERIVPGQPSAGTGLSRVTPFPIKAAPKPAAESPLPVAAELAAAAREDAVRDEPRAAADWAAGGDRAATGMAQQASAGGARRVTSAAWPAQATFGAPAYSSEPARQAADKPFIAPRAATPTSAPAAAAPAPKPAAEPDHRRRGLRLPGLLERVTGAARSRQEAAPAPAASPERKPAPAPETADRKPLGGMDPADRLAISKQDEDLLDIPAFLRRQAN